MFVTKKRFEEECLKIREEVEDTRDRNSSIIEIHRLRGLADCFDGLQSEVEELRETVRKLSQRPEMVSCESCGCLVLKENAVEGEAVVKRKGFSIDELTVAVMFERDLRDNKYIHTPYYCKFCAPEEE